MKPSVQHTLFQQIHNYLNAFLDDWQSLYTQLYTPNRRKIQEIIVAQFDRHNISLQVLHDKPLLLSGQSMQQAAKSLLLYFPFSPTSPLFTTTNVLTPFLASLTALAAYKTVAREPIKMIWLFEEQARPYTSLLSTLEPTQLAAMQANGCLWFTPKPEDFATYPHLALGAKGLLSVQLTVNSGPEPIPASFGSILPNAAWQLTWLLNSLKDWREDILIEGFYDNLTPLDDDAIDLLNTLPSITEYTHQRWGIEHLLMNLQGLQQYYVYFLTPTCTITSLSSDIAKHHDHTATISHYMPAQAQAQVGFQLVPGQNSYDILQKLQQHLTQAQHTRVTVEALHHSQPVYTPLANPFMQCVQRGLRHTVAEKLHIVPLLADLSAPSIFQELYNMPIALLPQVAMPVESSPQDIHQRLMQETKKIAAILLEMDEASQ